MAMIGVSFVAQLVDLLADLLTEGNAAAARISGVLTEIRRLQSTLKMIRSVLGDAEKRRMEDSAINLWVKELKDVVYDVDDLIDLCRLEFLKQMPSAEQPAPATAPRVCCFLPIFTRVARRNEISHRIMVINDRLEEISKRRAKFHLQAVDPNIRATVVSRRTSPILRLSSDVEGVGIGEDTRVMIDLLIEEREQKNSIFAVTGKGGIGKTTIAQKIYSDHKIKDHFMLRLWVFVSRNFSETDLLRGIISSINPCIPHGAHTRQLLEEILFNLIVGKRFFLVLDDVWSTDAWEHVLRNPLQSGAHGSRILVTTRSEDVAKKMGAVHLHKVRPLGVEDSWSLLCKTVFTDEDEKEMERLRDIGLEIVNKCGGLPLALKLAGKTLRAKERSLREWSNVLKSLTSFSYGFKEEFMRLLYLSYEALPSQLQPCFLYCSMFPENRVMARRDLIQLWIAEGFVKPDPSLALEEVAESYYAEIAASSLLQLEAEGMEADEGCRMHDVIRDLAFILAEDDSCAGDVRRLQESPMRFRRLSIASSEAISSSDIISHEKNLRDLLIFDNPMTDSVLRDLLHELGHLRVLDLRGTGIEEVPSSLGNLFHLRYLNLSRTRIRVLPDSIKELRYLQFLNLNGCKDLCRLPAVMSQLHNLRSLDLLHTAVDQIPSGLGSLKHLNTILGYVVSHVDPMLRDFTSLKRLRDLNIRKLDRAATVGAALSTQLLIGHPLRSLVLSCQKIFHPADEVDDSAIFDYLRPPSLLEQLTIDGYRGIEYPSWMFSPSDYPNLVRLNLKSCPSCKRLPPLGQLPMLKYLCISDSLEIVTIGTEFFGYSWDSFPKLERLVIEDMPNWEEWHGPEGLTLPLLRQLHLSKCPKLSSLPRCLQYYSTSLTELVIKAADSIRAIEGLDSITLLHLEDCPNMEKISCLPALKSLHIIKCPLLGDVSGVEALQHLVLVDFAIESLPQWLQLRTLHTLDVTGNRDLLKSFHKGGQEWHNIARIPHLYAHSADGSTYFAYTKGTLNFNSKLSETTTKHYGLLSNKGIISTTEISPEVLTEPHLDSHSSDGDIQSTDRRDTSSLESDSRHPDTSLESTSLNADLSIRKVQTSQLHTVWRDIPSTHSQSPNKRDTSPESYSWHPDTSPESRSPPASPINWKRLVFSSRSRKAESQHTWRDIQSTNKRNTSLESDYEKNVDSWM